MGVRFRRRKLGRMSGSETRTNSACYKSAHKRATKFCLVETLVEIPIDSPWALLALIYSPSAWAGVYRPQSSPGQNWHRK